MVRVNIQGMAIDITETYHTEVASIDRKKNFDKWGQKTNPLDKSENISRCAIYQSIYHWANDCPMILLIMLK